MQLFGIYTSRFLNGETNCYVALCTRTADIVHSSEPGSTEDLGRHLISTVQIEFNGEYLLFACDSGSLTPQGQADFKDFLAQNPTLVDKEKAPVLRDYQPTNGAIAVVANNTEEAFEKIKEALDAHPDIECDWIDGIEIEEGV